MENVYGHRGFNRISIDSTGINIYTGIKSSLKVIPNPVYLFVLHISAIE
jgi:hypothetical protein